MKFLRHLISLLRFMQLPGEKRRVVFYSEGKPYWTHLEGIITELLNSTNIPVCFISSGENDPGLSLQHPQYQSFLIDEGWIRNWLFQNINTDIMVMTMPDLHQYQVKRSRYPVHYMYVQHSLVSLHMVYRAGAFNHYDTICCSGSHHLKEAQQIEERYKLPKKNLLRHGYGRLDDIFKETGALRQSQNAAVTPYHVLVAPSWGERGVIEMVGEKLITCLLENGFKVTLRPHPRSLKLSKNKLKTILKKHGKNPMFDLERDVSGWKSLHLSHIMISDWSGAALDYAFGFEKPVLFLDTPRKINNPAYLSLGIEPFEVSVRNAIGSILDINHLDTLAATLNILLHTDFKPSIVKSREKYVYNFGTSHNVAANYIRSYYEKQRAL